MHLHCPVCSGLGPPLRVTLVGVVDSVLLGHTCWLVYVQSDSGHLARYLVTLTFTSRLSGFQVSPEDEPVQLPAPVSPSEGRALGLGAGASFACPRGTLENLSTLCWTLCWIPWRDEYPLESGRVRDGMM